MTNYWSKIALFSDGTCSSKTTLFISQRLRYRLLYHLLWLGGLFRDLRRRSWLFLTLSHGCVTRFLSLTDIRVVFNLITLPLLPCEHVDFKGCRCRVAVAASTLECALHRHLHLFFLFTELHQTWHVVFTIIIFLKATWHGGKSICYGRESFLRLFLLLRFGLILFARAVCLQFVHFYFSINFKHSLITKE